MPQQPSFCNKIAQSYPSYDECYPRSSCSTFITPLSKPQSKPPKTNIAPENQCQEKPILFAPCLFFQGLSAFTTSSSTLHSPCDRRFNGCRGLQLGLQLRVPKFRIDRRSSSAMALIGLFDDATKLFFIHHGTIPR